MVSDGSRNLKFFTSKIYHRNSMLFWAYLMFRNFLSFQSYMSHNLATFEYCKNLQEYLSLCVCQTGHNRLVWLLSNGAFKFESLAVLPKLDLINQFYQFQIIFYLCRSANSSLIEQLDDSAPLCVCHTNHISAGF